jgi:hypothetical protein
MPFQIHWVPKGVIWDYEGEITPSDILASNESVYGDARFDALRFEIANFLSVSPAKFSPKDVRLIAAMDRAAALTNPSVRVALVAVDSNVRDLLTVYCEGLNGSPWQAKVVSSLVEAACWLEVDEKSVTGAEREQVS